MGCAQLRLKAKKVYLLLYQCTFPSYLTITCGCSGELDLLEGCNSTNYWSSVQIADRCVILDPWPKVNTIKMTMPIDYNKYGENTIGSLGETDYHVVVSAESSVYSSFQVIFLLKCMNMVSSTQTDTCFH